MKSFLAIVGLVCGVSAIQAAQVTYQFTGTTMQTMTVNNGSSNGSVPVGTP